MLLYVCMCIYLNETKKARQTRVRESFGRFVKKSSFVTKQVTALAAYPIAPAKILILVAGPDCFVGK